MLFLELLTRNIKDQVLECFVYAVAVEFYKVYCLT